MSADADLIRSGRGFETEENFRLEKDPGNGPFELTDLQQGYWLGETENLGLSGPAFFYSLHSCETLDVSRFDAAINAIISRHDILRTRYTPDARHETVSALPCFRSEFIDASGKSDEEVQDTLDDIGERIVRNRFRLEDWPLFRFWIVKTSRGFFVWSMFKLIIVDGRSGEIFAHELRELLLGRPLGTPDIRFRDFVHSLNAYRKTGKYQKSQEYWKSLELAPPPDLPKVSDWEKGGFIPMTHRTFTLPAADWKNVKEECRRRGVAPTAFMCSLFCSVLAYWSRNSHFTLAVMYANRPNISREIFDVFGNFSNTILATHEWPERESFAEKTRKLQAMLLKRLSHGHVSGVEVMRELHSNRAGGGISLMPVVFACGLGLSSEDDDEPLFLEKLGWKSIKTGINTPRVVFNHRIAENRGELLVNWDTRDCLFPAGLIDDMFSAYESLLRAFAARQALWDESFFELDGFGSRTNAPRTPVESGIIRIWRKVLRSPSLDRTSNFFHAGGNSILAISVLYEIEAAYKVRMPLSVLYQRQTVSQIAEYLQTYRPAKQDVLVPIHQKGNARKLFLVHPIGGGILCYAPAAKVFKSDFDVIAVQSLSQAHPGSSPVGIEEMAEVYADRVAAVNGSEEVSLLGWSMGGLLSIAMKRILERKGLRVRVVALDPWIGKSDKEGSGYSPELAVAEFFQALNCGKPPSENFRFSSTNKVEMLLEYLEHMEPTSTGPATFRIDTLVRLFDEYDRNLLAILEYALPPLDGDVAVFRAARTDRSVFRFLRPVADVLEPLTQAGTVLVEESHFSIVSEGFLRSQKAQILGMLGHSGREEGM